MGIAIKEEDIEKMCRTDYESLIKGAVRKASIEHLLLIQQSHSKYKQVKHKTFRM